MAVKAVLILLTIFVMGCSGGGGSEAGAASETTPGNNDLSSNDNPDFETTPPIAPVVVSTTVNDSSVPVVTGTYDSANTANLTVTINGVAASVETTGDNWTATGASTLPAGSYEVTATATGEANSASVDISSDELTVTNTVVVAETCGTEPAGDQGELGEANSGVAVEYESKVDADALIWAAANSWLDTATGQSNGSYPGANDGVLIPEGSTVCVNGDVAARELTVNGELFVQATKDSYSLTTHHVLVSGANASFTVGSAESPFTKEFVLELIGTGDSSEPSIDSMSATNQKFLMSMMGGTISLHGEERISWTKLAGDKLYNRGETVLTLAEIVDWQAGDRIVIAPSTAIDEYEELEIVSVLGSEITLKQGLRYRHFGGDTADYQAYIDGPFLTLDQRAEVGLLTRNVKVVGDANSDVDGFGGHIMVMPDSNGHVSHVELYQLGQRGVLARYPMHWHLNGATSGQFIEHSSIHKSYHRAVTVHGTSDVRVENNVAYNIPGHAYFLENGAEERNQFIDNLAIDIYRPAAADAILESDFAFNEQQNRSPSAFWISNPANTFVGNVAAGSPGTGFWFALRANSGEFAGTGIYGAEKQITLFAGNVAHHVMNGIDAMDHIRCEGCQNDLIKNGRWVKVNDESNIIDRFTAYGTTIGAYTGNNTKARISSSGSYTLEIRNSIFADNEMATMFASREKIKDSVIIAETYNGLTNLNTIRQVFRLYDGAAKIERSHVIGFNSAANPPTTFGKTMGGAIKNINWEVENITGDKPRNAWPDYASVPAPTADDFLNAHFDGHPRRWSNTLYDYDGYMVGAGQTIIANHPMLMVGSNQTEYTEAGSENTYFTDRSYGHLRMMYTLGAGQQPDVDITRVDITGNTADVFLENHYKVNFGHQQPVIMRDAANEVDFYYRLSYDDPFSLKEITLQLSDAMAAGQEALIVIEDVGAYAGLSLAGSSSYNNALTSLAIPELASVTAVRNSTSPAYFASPGGELLVKLVSQNAGAPQVFVQITWD